MNKCEEGNHVNEEIFSRAFDADKIAQLPNNQILISQPGRATESVITGNQRDTRVLCRKIPYFKYQLAFKQLISIVKGKVNTKSLNTQLEMDAQLLQGQDIEKQLKK